MQKTLLFILISFFGIGHGMAQKSLSATTTSIGVADPGPGKLYYGDRSEPPRAIAFEQGTVATSTFMAGINRYFGIPAEFTFRETESNTDDLGMRHHLLQQYYNGMLLEGMGYRVHEKNGFVTSANGRAVRHINLDMQGSLSEELAFQLAVKYVNSQDPTVREGTKLIVSKGFTYAPESFSVAFQFDIDVSLVERWRVSIDARDGKLVNKVSLVNSCGDEAAPPLPYSTSTGLTSYYGNKTIRVEVSGSGSQMTGQTEHGGLIASYNFGNRDMIILQVGIPFTPPIFYSYNNSYSDNTAVSAQWAMEQAFEYYFKKHNRNSFDNNGGMIKSYVHVDVRLDNAFWTGKLLALGDGSSNNPLVELDVIGHELTHGVTQYEAGLSYSNEPGALNESFSDILGKAVEFDVFGNAATWQIGRYFRSGGLRDMSNPNLKSQPDTYAGDLWYTGYEDYGGVHTNSGVQNYWFYLLCNGGTGVNDHQVSYSVNSIGMDAAVKIVYRNLTEYLGAQSDYLDSRIGSMLAAADLYGANSTAYQEVDKAWDAVGVIDEPTVTSLDVYDITATTVKIKGSLIPRSDAATYHFEYGTTPALGSSTSDYAYTGKVDGILTGLQSNTKYYLRLVATNEHGNTYFNTEFTTISLAPLVKITQTVDITETAATLYGQLNPNSLPTSFHFEYGPTPAFGLVTPSVPVSGTTEFERVSASVTDLQPRQTYYYRLVATNGYATAKTTSASLLTAMKPVITSYTPATAPVDAEVTITGRYFNSIPQKNVVSFGATQGTVVSSSTTEIKVKVPAGASLGPVSVYDTESGLAGESTQEFVPTFTGDFKKGDFHLATGSTDYLYQTLVQDMDGDGKPDIIARQYLGFSVFLNVNQGGDIVDQSFVRSSFTSEYTPGTLSLVDFDGNGLKDIVGTYQGALRIYPNLSVPGYIFFGVPVDLPIPNVLQFEFNDFDQDGHPDIAVTSRLPGDNNLVTIIRNQNPKGFLSPENFVDQFSMAVPYLIRDLYTDDLNNDGKPELMASLSSKTFIPILINDSRPGVFAFSETTVQDAMIQYPQYVSQDLNQDGWKDIVSYSPYGGVSLGILENKKTSPGVSVGTMVSALTGYEASVVKPGDINGDGAVDLLVSLDNGQFAFFENNTGANAPISDASFNKFATYGAENIYVSNQSSMIVNDLNGDGRPEIINTWSYSNLQHDGFQMEIWQNSPNDCLDPSLIGLTVTGNTATITLPAGTNRDQFEINYAPVGNTYWWSVSSTTINYLTPGEDYRLRVRAKCLYGFTDYFYINFKGECINTSSFTISDIGIDNVFLTATDFSSMEVQYSLAGQNQWISQYYTQITNLLPGTTYDLRFRGTCAAPTDYKYKELTTLCPQLASLNASSILYNKIEVRWMSNYAGTAILEYSDDNTVWTPIDATRTIYSTTPGKKYFIRGHFVCTNGTSDFSYTSVTTPCLKVSSVSVDTIMPFSARINWIDQSGADSYTVTYGPTGSDVTTMETSSTSFDMDGLMAGTNYTVAVAPQCLLKKEFTSATFNTVCYAPVNLLIDAVTYTTAALSWTDNIGSASYFVDYSIVNSNVWQTAETASTNISLTDLRPGTKYDVRVHIGCSLQTLTYATQRFETGLYENTKFSPNPTNSKVSVYPSKNLIGNRYQIYDNMGRSIISGELLDYTLDFSTFSAGIYTLQIEGEPAMRIVKQ